VKPTLAERCLRQPLRPDSNAQDWYTKSFDSRSRSAASTTNKSNSLKQQSRHASADVPKKSETSQQNSGKEICFYIKKTKKIDSFRKRTN
jgi:hypothetical protein